jgi:uncharacterized membrane protein
MRQNKMLALFVALFLGFIAGLRTFTAPAVLWLLKHGTVWAYVLGACAVAEYVGDLYPNAPPRTDLAGVLARLISGGFCGWAVTSTSDRVLGIILGGVGALAGTYLSYRARMRAIQFVGRVPAALIEDAVAIVGSALIIASAQ